MIIISAYFATLNSLGLQEQMQIFWFLNPDILKFDSTPESKTKECANFKFVVKSYVK